MRSDRQRRLTGHDQTALQHSDGPISLATFCEVEAHPPIERVEQFRQGSPCLGVFGQLLDLIEQGQRVLDLLLRVTSVGGGIDLLIANGLDLTTQMLDLRLLRLPFSPNQFRVVLITRAGKVSLYQSKVVLCRLQTGLQMF
ncbi:MAG TPA: hypothetical protein VGI81_00285 [Tepidisphaeraceae bacterium]